MIANYKNREFLHRYAAKRLKAHDAFKLSSVRKFSNIGKFIRQCPLTIVRIKEEAFI